YATLFRSQRLGLQHAVEGSVGRAALVVWVTSDRHLGRRPLDEVGVADLHLAGDQLVDQQAVGDIPALAVAWGQRVSDLHTALVVVVDQPHAVLSLGVRLGAVVLRRILAPQPGPLDRRVGGHAVARAP